MWKISGDVCFTNEHLIYELSRIKAIKGAFGHGNQPTPYTHRNRQWLVRKKNYIKYNGIYYQGGRTAELCVLAIRFTGISGKIILSWHWSVYYNGNRYSVRIVRSMHRNLFVVLYLQLLRSEMMRWRAFDAFSCKTCLCELGFDNCAATHMFVTVTPLKKSSFTLFSR